MPAFSIKDLTMVERNEWNAITLKKKALDGIGGLTQQERAERYNTICEELEQLKERITLRLRK